VSFIWTGIILKNNPILIFTAREKNHNLSKSIFLKYLNINKLFSNLSSFISSYFSKNNQINIAIKGNNQKRKNDFSYQIFGIKYHINNEPKESPIKKNILKIPTFLHTFLPFDKEII
jgi:hypothetical protein